MMKFLKRLLGIAEAPATAAPTHSARASRPTATSAPVGDQDGGREGSTGEAVNRYFELSMAIEEGNRDRDYPRAIRAARATYQILPDVVRQWKREYGRFDINTSHAVHTAPKLMALIEDRDGIRELRAVLESVKDLHDWLPSAEEAETDVEVVPQIMALVQAEPGVLQSALKTRLPGETGADAGSGASNLAAWLEKAGRIQRVKKGSSYQLYPAGYQIPTAAASSSSSSSSLPSARSSSSSSSSSSSVLAPPWQPRARSRRAAAKARLLDFSGLPVVRLPKAPASWEERAAREEGDGREEQIGATPAAKRVRPSSPSRPRVGASPPRRSSRRPTGRTRRSKRSSRPAVSPTGLTPKGNAKASSTPPRSYA